MDTGRNPFIFFSQFLVSFPTAGLYSLLIEAQLVTLMDTGRNQFIFFSQFLVSFPTAGL